MTNYIDEYRKRKMIQEPEDMSPQSSETEDSLVTGDPLDPEDPQNVAGTRPSDPLIGQNASIDPSSYTPSYGPKTSAYMEQASKVPQRTDYQPSGFRKVLGAVAGIGNGIAYGPKAGEESARAVLDLPYNRAMSDYQRNLGASEIGAKEEQGQVGVQTKAAEAIANRGAAEARAKMYGANADRFRTMVTPEYLDAARDRAIQVANARTRPVVADPTKNVIGPDGKVIQQGVPAAPKPKTGIFRAQQILDEVDQDPNSHTPGEVAVAKAMVEHLNNTNTVPTEQQVIEGTKKHLGRDLTPDELVKLHHELQPDQKPPQALGVPEGGGTAINIKPGVNVPGNIVLPGQMGQENVAKGKKDQQRQEAIVDNQKNYHVAEKLAAQDTSPSDAALVMQFMGMIKPDSMGKMRFQQSEQNFILGTRNSLGDLEALYQKVADGGQKLTPDQRQQMLKTMKLFAFPMDESGSSNGSIPKPGESFNGHKVLKVTKVP